MKAPSVFTFLDSTLRDCGYYTVWDFRLELIQKYLLAMKAAQVDVVGVGFRFLKNQDFKGPFAFKTEHFLE